MLIDPLKTSLAFLPVQFSRNKIEYVIDPADTSLADRSGLRYYLELLVPEFAGSSQFERLVKMPGAEKPPTSGGGSVVYEGAFFLLDELLDGFLEHQKPDAGAAGMCIVSTLTMPYMVRETVENNGQVLAGSAREQASKWLLKAGLQERDFVAWGGAFFTDYMRANRPFLTWQPDNKLVSAGQEEYLFFLLNCQPTPATLIRRVRITYQDGTMETKDAGQLSGGQAYQVVCVPVGPKALGLASNVASYEVWLADTNYYRISQVRTYQIDPQFRSQERWLLFSNSLGGWDTLRLLGEGSETLTTQRTVAELERPVGAPADYNELRVIYVQGSRTLQVNTGYFEQHQAAQLAYLDELLLTKDLYLVDARGHQALELLTTSLVDSEDDSDLVSRSFSFRIVTPQVNFSTMPAAPATPARPTGWRGVGVVQVLDGNGKRTGKGRPLKLQKYYLDDASVYKPITEKPNQPGDPDFVESLPLPGTVAGSTPYPNQALTRPTTFTRSTCPNGQLGEAALVVVPAGTYGSEMSQADADSKAEAAYRALNTQAYADEFGSCTVAPELYQVAVPAGQWHYRVNNPQLVEVEWLQLDSQELKIGNTWDLQGQNRPFVYPRFSSGLNFPVRASDWRFFTYGPYSSQVNVKIYQNGVLRFDRTLTMNRDNYEYLSLSQELITGGRALTYGDKLYFKATPL